MARALLGMATMLMLGAMLFAAPVRTTGAGGMMMIGLLFGGGSSGSWLVLWAVMAHGAVPGPALRRVGTFTSVSKLAQGAVREATCPPGRIRHGAWPALPSSSQPWSVIRWVRLAQGVAVLFVGQVLSQAVRLAVQDDLDTGVLRVATGLIVETFRYATDTGRLVSPDGPPPAAPSVPPAG